MGRPAVNLARHAPPHQVRGARGSAPLRGRPCPGGAPLPAVAVHIGANVMVSVGTAHDAQRRVAVETFNDSAGVATGLAG